MMFPSSDPPFLKEVSPYVNIAICLDHPTTINTGRIIPHFFFRSTAAGVDC
jgi:hypothetical protein